MNTMDKQAKYEELKGLVQKIISIKKDIRDDIDLNLGEDIETADNSILSVFMSEFNKRYSEFIEEYGEDDVRQIRDEIKDI